MELKDRLILILLGLVLLMGGAGILGIAWTRHQATKVRVDLQNQLAAKDKTIEEKQGLYEKLSLQDKNVLNDLDLTNKQNQELRDQLKASGQQLLDATQAVLTWKQKFEGVVRATQTTVPTTSGTKSGSATGSSRDRVDFQQVFEAGDVGVKGYTISNPAEAYLQIWQLRPLKLTVAMAQDKTKAWHAYVTSSEDGIQADIAVASVNPNLEETKWYERLAVQADLGLGTTPVGLGLLGGVGAEVPFGKFDVGPHVWFTASDRIDRFLGATVTWHPFQR